MGPVIAVGPLAKFHNGVLVILQMLDRLWIRIRDTLGSLYLICDQCRVDGTSHGNMAWLS